jgi:hypothetical protein
MNKKISILILSIVSFLGTGLHAEFTGEVPKETAILQLPDHSESNWKEIAHYVSAKEGIIEAIPLNQTIQNWSELIAVQYMSSAEWDKSACTLEKVLEHVRKETLSAYPKDTVSWQIIEKSKEGIIYEWIMHKPYKNISVEHEVARAFLTPSGFHRVGFTRKNGPMSSEERAKWIQLLRENSSVVSFQDGGYIEGFSMVEKLQNSVYVGAHFRDWRRINQFAFETGYSLVCFIPPTQVDSYVAECLEIVTVPNVKLAPLANFFEIEKKCVQEKTSKKMRFHILEQSPTEIIYCYCHPKDHLQLNAVVRTFLTEHGYYSISYKKGLEGRMQKEEMRSWMEKLKTIQAQVPSKSIKVAV